MKSKWITVKERNLLKGALRRVFARAEVRKQVLDAAEIEHKDRDRPRVTKWALCTLCKRPCAKYQCVVDHISPVIPLGKSMETMDLDDVADRLWCEPRNLQVVCAPCHKAKTKEENAQRRKLKKESKK